MEYICVGRKIVYRFCNPTYRLAPSMLMERASNMDSMDVYNAELETLHLMVTVLVVTSILFTT
jgi:hypothetical protein